MLSLERQNAIMDILLGKKVVSVAELAEQYNVSYETIRRDLKALEKETGIERTYGGAVLRDPKRRNYSYESVSRFMKSTKMALSSRALGFIKPDECLFVDFSTTCLPIVQLLPDISVNLLTNSLEVANVVSDRKNVRVFITGGFFDSSCRGFFGAGAVDSLKHYNLDKAFISCRSLSMEHGLSDKNENESALRRAVVNSAREVYLLVDNSKFGWDAFMHTCDFKRITAVLTDKHLDAEWSDFFAQQGVCVYDGIQGAEE